MPLEEIPVFHLYSASEEKPLSKDERQRLLEELRRKLAEIKEIKQKLHMLEHPSTASPALPATAMDTHSPQELATALEELRVPALELLQDRPSPKKVLAKEP
ncbi:MAG: hypothetical protein IPJ89_03600 [Candidatus Iainarchaeum archaeon]|uniref:Uncharacterized protein n=1 Tax=Candidatus Iainarchaeum sp. TaxID=3101447 RepID=A0A7T9DIZ3_9ARCH|nr:MAG: hypothetical protein IPJ89_03600 [Candidatus Diapherotrites archaeon]